MSRYTPVDFQPNQLLTESTLDDLASNSQYFYDNMPQVTFFSAGESKKEQVKIISGRILVPASTETASHTQVNFPNVFSTACAPNVTTALCSKVQRRLHLTIDGIGGVTLPDYRGFQVHLYTDRNAPKGSANITNNCYVSWQAMGF